jgi:hypothetical protein
MMPLPAASRKFALDNVSGWPERAIVAAITVLVAIPCFWQAGFFVGALSGHAYNAWLAGETRQNRAPGLEIVPVWTSVLADWTLDLLSRPGNTDAAVRVVAAAAALIFFWGAFFMLNAVSGRRPWALFPLLGILTYGIVFHLGYLNFYLSAGLSFWAIGLLWNPSRSRAIFAALVAVVALLAHPIPPAWAAAVACYLYLFRKAPAVLRLLMPVLGIVGIMAAQQALTDRLLVRWSWSRLGQAAFVGADQAWIYDDKYFLIAGGVLLCMIWLFVRKVDQLDFLGDPALQVWILHLAASLLLPGSAGLLASEPALIGVGTSLFVAISFLMMVSDVEQGYGITRLSSAIAAAFFFFLYLDSTALNRAQDEITRLVREVPEGARLAVPVTDEGSRVNGLAHAPSRACIGHCFSYANSEPARQFRIRSDGKQGGVAAPDAQTVREIERGEHIVTPAEQPLFVVCACGSESGALCVRRLESGQRTCASARPVTLRLWRRFY